MMHDQLEEKPIKRQRMFFIDSENGLTVLTEGFEALCPSDIIVVFHRSALPRGARERLEMGPARIELVECVDPGVKNSMDVQIIAELSMRFGKEVFDEGYVISADKGFLPAVHYLQARYSAQGCVIEQARSINHALHLSILRMLSSIESFESRDDVISSFALFLGDKRAECAVEKLADVLAPKGNASVTQVVQGNPPDRGTVIEFSIPEQRGASSERLVDLKGIGTELSVKLKNAGISTPAKLRQIGAVEAWRRIREQDHSFATRWVYVFEAAITGSALNGIGAKRKQELKRQIKAKAS